MLYVLIVDIQLYLEELITMMILLTGIQLMLLEHHHHLYETIVYQNDLIGVDLLIRLEDIHQDHFMPLIDLQVEVEEEILMNLL